MARSWIPQSHQGRRIGAPVAVAFLPGARRTPNTTDNRRPAGCRVLLQSLASGYSTFRTYRTTLAEPISLPTWSDRLLQPRIYLSLATLLLVRAFKFQRRRIVVY